MRLLAVLAALIVPLAAYLPVYQEREKTIESAEKEIRELDMHIEQAHAAQRKLTQFHEEVDRLHVELVKLRRILPPDPDLDGVRTIVEEKAATSSIRIERFAPRETTKHEYLAIPIDTEAVGSLVELESFFKAIANGYRIIDVTDVSLQKDVGDRWRATFLMTTSALPD